MELTIKQKLNYLPTGFAIFSMFFGAGNSIFPLLIGSLSGSYNLYAVFGLTISTIIVPLLGLLAMKLFDGNYKDFFYRLGKVPGFMIITMIMLLIGPFAGIPRCITLSYATLKPHLGPTSLVLFSALACVLIFFKTIKKTKVIDILGKVLTPILLACLTVIIIKGMYAPGNMAPPVGLHTKTTIFFQGLTEGFQMMDLLASFFFSATVLSCLKAKKGLSAQPGRPDESKNTFVKAITLAGILLTIVYVGFSYVAAHNSAFFQSIPKEALLGAVSRLILGQHMGFVMGFAVALACLTTAITLVSIFSEYLYRDCLKKRVPYLVCICATILIAFCCSNLGFVGICNLIAPILMVCYPALITLTVLNIAYKVFHFKPVRWPVYAVLCISLLANIIR